MCAHAYVHVYTCMRMIRGSGMVGGGHGVTRVDGPNMDVMPMRIMRAGARASRVYACMRVCICA